MDEFMSIPELQQNPLVKRVIDILDTDRNGEVDFQGRLIGFLACEQGIFEIGLRLSQINCQPMFSLIAEFIEGVSQFSVKGDKEKKLRCKCFCLLSVR